MMMSRREVSSALAKIPPHKRKMKADSSKEGVLVILGTILARILLGEEMGIAYVMTGAAVGGWLVSGELARLRVRQFVGFLLGARGHGEDGHR